MFFLQRADFLLITLGTGRAAQVFDMKVLDWQVLDFKTPDLTRQCLAQDALDWHL
jgi:hypothetical protein